MNEAQVEIVALWNVFLLGGASAYHRETMSVLPTPEVSERITALVEEMHAADPTTTDAFLSSLPGYTAFEDRVLAIHTKKGKDEVYH